MPFVKVKIEEVIEQKCQQSESFKKNWDESKNRENMPTLRTFCNLLSAIGYELQIVKKTN